MARSREFYISLVAKCLALANNAGTQEEAHAAMLRAQQIMYDRDITESEAQNFDMDEEDAHAVDAILDQWKTVRGWKGLLAKYIAANFRCKEYFVKGHDPKNPRSKYIQLRFVGYLEDVKVASMVYHTGVHAAEGLCSRFLANNEHMYTNRNDAKSSYLSGFVAGVRKKFEEQVQSMALMVVADQLVIQYVDQETAGGRIDLKDGYRDEERALLAGFKDGQGFAGRNKQVTGGDSNGDIN